ncbi:MAG: hypothetical protein MHM6MM_000740 [Cercozoa sp. M6MM]
MLFDLHALSPKVHRESCMILMTHSRAGLYRYSTTSKKSLTANSKASLGLQPFRLLENSNNTSEVNRLGSLAFDLRFKSKSVISRSHTRSLSTGNTRMALNYLFGRKLASGFGSGSTASEVADTFADRIRECTVCITGANTGLGKHTALHVARVGGSVIMMGRNPTTLDAAAKEVRTSALNDDVQVHTVVCDLNDFDSIREAAQQVRSLQLEKPFTVLLNNAGVMMCPRTVIDGVEMQMRTNVFGHYLLTNELLPLLRANENCRVVNVSSVAHKWATPSLGLDDLAAEKSYNEKERYGDSKLSNALHAVALSKLEGVTAVSLHPGVIPSSDLGRHMSRTKISLAKTVLRPFFKTVPQGAATGVYCCFAPEVVNGGYYADCNLKMQPEEVDSLVSADTKLALLNTCAETTHSPLLAE